MRESQKTEETGYHQKNSVEHKGYEGARRIPCGEKKVQDGVLNLFEIIFEKNNLNQAYLTGSQK